MDARASSMDMMTLALILVLILVQSFGIWAEFRNGKRSKELVVSLTKSWIDLGAIVEKASVQAQAMQKQAGVAMKGLIDPPVAKGATRVYAAILTFQGQSKLYVAPAESMEEFAIAGKAVVGDYWKAEQVQYAEIYPPAEKIVHVPVVPNKREAKKVKTEEFVNQLMLARDTFTDTDYQKRALDAIIKNVKTKYEPA